SWKHVSPVEFRCVPRQVLNHQRYAAMSHEDDAPKPRAKTLEDMADIIDVESFTPEQKVEIEAMWAEGAAEADYIEAGLRKLMEGRKRTMFLTHLPSAIVEICSPMEISEIILGLEMDHEDKWGEKPQRL